MAGRRHADNATTSAGEFESGVGPRRAGSNGRSVPSVDRRLEQAYSPSSMVGGSAQPFIDDYVARSARAAADLGGRVLTLEGGTVVVRPRSGHPTLVFVHGGYWQALSAADSLFLAPPVVSSGWGYAAVEYTVAPVGTVERMLADVSEALVAVGSAVGGPLVVAGHSAGAQLVAMTTLAHPSAADVRRCVLVSGVFDLRELPGTSMNDALRLDAERAAALSPLVAGVRVTSIPVELWWGDRDTPRFAEMSRDYGALLAAGGCQVDLREFAGTHHFDIVDRLTELTTAP